MTTSKKKGPTQQEQMAARGYFKISEVAAKIGRPVFFIHRAIKTGALKLGTDFTSDAVRIGYTYYVREAAVVKLVGPVGAKLAGLKVAGARA